MALAQVSGKRVQKWETWRKTWKIWLNSKQQNHKKSSKLNKNDDFNRSFVVNLYKILTQNFNPFSLDRKFIKQNDQQIIYVLCEKYVPPGFYKFICRKDNFMFLNGLNVTGHKRAKLFTNLQRRKILKWKSFELFWRYQLIYQRFYSLLFTKYFMPNRKGGVNIRSYFLLHVKEWLVDKKKR